MSQFQNLKCKIHPDGNVIAVNAELVCTRESRFICLLCIQSGLDNKTYVDIQQFHNQIVQVMNTAALVGSPEIVQLQYYLTTQVNELIKYQSNLMAAYNQLQRSLKEVITTNMVWIREFVQNVAQLKSIFENERRKINQKWSQTARIKDYHKSQEWLDLESMTSQYVKLFYNVENTQINIIVDKMQAGIFQMIQQQHDLDKYFDTFKKEASTILDNLKSQEPQAITMLPLFKILPFWIQLKSKITQDDQNKKLQLIFKGTRDGMNSQAFWMKCENVQQTLVLCVSKSGSIFGGYTPCKWIKNEKLQLDNEGTSFLFSVTRQEIYPIKLSHPSIIGYSKQGPNFGGQQDLSIDENFQKGSSKLDNGSYSNKGYLITNPKTHLMGGEQPNLREMEVYTIA